MDANNHSNTIKRRRGRPRKSEEEKKANRAAYYKRYMASLNPERRKRRQAQTRKSHDAWYETHKEEWREYMREYRKRRAAIDEINKD